MIAQGQKPYRKIDHLFPWLALALVLVVMGGIIVYSLHQEHVRIERREGERLATQARVIDENLNLQLYGVYRALEEIRKGLPSLKGKNARKSASHRLSDMADAMPGVRTFLIADATGNIVASSREQVLGLNIRNRGWFQTPLINKNPDKLYISPPFISLLGNFVITAGLILPGPTGEFNGVVTASLDSDYFNVLLGSVLYTSDMWCALVHGDGKLFLRVPEVKGLVGMDLAKPGTLFTRHIKSGRPATVLTGLIPRDGQTRMMAQRTVRSDNVPMDKPLVVSVSREVSALYKDWRRDVWGKGALFGVLVLATTSALYFYQRRQRKFEALSVDFVEKLLQAKETAVRANIDKSRLLATVAHEFRTPLSILTSSTDILDRYGERLNRIEFTLQNDRIRTAARRMSDLIDSVLSYNRLAITSHHNDPVVLDVRNFFCKLAKEVNVVCGKDHEFTFSISDDCGTILLDEILVRRVAENLLTNAFRYTPATGAISLHVSRETDRLRVVVTDSGIGIPEEDQKNIFEEFFRCRNVEARSGLGLGLSIVRDAVLEMGGVVTVDSSVGKGTSMRVEIPIVEQAGSEEQPS